VFSTVNERPDDLELVRLVLARQRLHGEGFDQAWEMALGAIPVFDATPNSRRGRRSNAHIDRASSPELTSKAR
jgi:hypothetical protein